MATELNLKVKTVDSNNKSYTKTFPASSQLGTNTDPYMKGFANIYAGLTDYSTKSAQKVQYDDIDLATN